MSQYMPMGDQYPGALPGLGALPPAQQVGADYQLRPFEYFRNEGGQRYVQNALSNPGETPGYQPPPPLPPPGNPGASSVNLPLGSPPPMLPGPAPQTGGGEPYPGALPPPQSNIGSMNGSPWASFFQGLSRTQGPSQSGAWGQTKDLRTQAPRTLDRTADGVPQSWQQSTRGFKPGGFMSPGASRSPFARMFNPAVMPPPAQMATPEPPLANAGYFPGPALPPPSAPQVAQTPSWQQQFNGGPG